MKLYHGSENIIEKPQYGQGNQRNDYGRGFYCTESAELACEWAVKNGKDGYSNGYLFDVNGLTVLDLRQGSSSLEWITILLENRLLDTYSDFGKEAIAYLKNEYSLPYNEYDVIIGYRADDSYFSFAQDFLNNVISLSSLSKALKLGLLGEQIVLKSEKAFERIEFKSATRAEASEWYLKRERRDLNARRDYKMMRNEPWKRGEIYMMQILEQEIKRDDPRIR